MARVVREGSSFLSYASTTTSYSMSTLKRNRSWFGRRKNQRITEHNVSPSDLADFRTDYILFDEVLGTGTSGEVRLVRHRNSGGAKRAVKIVKKDTLSESDLNDLYQEIYIMQHLDHPGVIKCHDHYEDDDLIYIVMDHISGGELFHGIENVKSYTEDHAIRIIRMLARILKYCSSQGVIHRDVKAENILLKTKDVNSDIVLVDFGMAAHVTFGTSSSNILTKMCGTPLYVAPEIVQRKKYNYKCDIWSLGVVAYILLSGSPHIPTKSQKELYEKLKSRRKIEFNPPELWEKVSDSAKDFLRHVLHFDPKKRYDYDQVLAHRWLSEDNVYNEALNIDSLKSFNSQRRLASRKS